MSESIKTIFAALELDATEVNAPAGLVSRTPIDGSQLARIPVSSAEACASAVARAKQTQARWRDVPAPRRGEEYQRKARERAYFWIFS